MAIEGGNVAEGSGDPHDKFGRLRRSLKRKGVLGTAAYLVYWRLRRQKDPASVFSQEFGVDLEGRIPVADLGIEGENEKFATYYEAAQPAVFHQMMAAVEIAHEEFTFLDVGSGKGGVLLYASRYPFRRIIGIELSAKLHRIAENNIRVYRDERQRCRELTAVCGDALEFPLPGGPLVLFLFNPFSRHVMARFLDCVEAEHRADPREIYLLYQTPVGQDAFRGREQFVLVKCKQARWWEGLQSEWAIYRLGS